MKRLLAVLSLLKGFYDVVAATLLPPVLYLALVSLGMYWAASALALQLGDGSALFLWQRAGAAFGVSSLTIRLMIFLPAHALLLSILYKPLMALWSKASLMLDSGSGNTGAARSEYPLLRQLLGLLLTLVMTFLLVAFALQPSLVSIFANDQNAWLERLANLLDGQAAHAAWDSTLILATPAPTQTSFHLAQADLRTSGMDSELMSRWDKLLTTSTKDDDHFAQTKAFMWVESAGRQFAVSHTGCAGLMQFCVSTAQRHPFRNIFGRGNIRACDCGGKACRVPKQVRDGLETDPELVKRPPASFPCDTTDARFSGPKAIAAGAAYTSELDAQVGGNLYLMYIGYNSGPAVAKRLFKTLDGDARADLDDIRPHLADTLRRWYGAKADHRAEDLLNNHLPKLQRAYDHYHP